MLMQMSFPINGSTESHGHGRNGVKEKHMWYEELFTSLQRSYDFSNQVASDLASFFSKLEDRVEDVPGDTMCHVTSVTSV